MIQHNTDAKNIPGTYVFTGSMSSKGYRRCVIAPGKARP